MNAETVNQVFKRLKNGKYKGRIVSHGFRAMASTIPNEHKFRSDVIEKQLAHQEGNKARQVYNHANHLEERTQVRQWYTDYPILKKKPLINLNNHLIVLWWQVKKTMMCAFRTTQTGDTKGVYTFPVLS